MRGVLFRVAVTFLFLVSGSKTETVTEHLTRPYGTIRTPGYPQPYNDNENITWVITTDPGYQIEIYFTDFDLEDSYDPNLGGACVYDYVEIENWGKKMRFCGNYREFSSDAPREFHKFRSENNSMTIQFVSDYSNEFRPYGFELHYQKIDKDECAIMRQEVRNAFEDWDELIYCNHYCINVPGSYYCTCRHGFELHENNHTCKASCDNQLITEDHGVITSPDYPNPYSRLTDCDWTIRVRPGLSLNLQFNGTFEIEDHFNYTECVFDWLKLSYGKHDQTYCHGAPNGGRIINTNLREAKLEFHTDGATEEAGFKMIFTTTKTRCLESRDASRHGNKTANPKGYYEFEDEITFQCNPGYTLTPSNGNIIRCQSNGTWTRQAPTCEIKYCGKPEQLLAVPYSKIEAINQLALTFRDEVNLECIKWYKHVSGVPRWRCSEDGTWKPKHNGLVQGSPIPVCKPICGQKNGKDRKFFHTQITGGFKADENEWPWMAFLNFGVDSSVSASRYTCGGALISPDFVLTAAHCVTGDVRHYPPDGERFANHTHVWLGAHDRALGRNSNAKLVGVSEIIRNPNYNLRFIDSDFALLRLSETVIMNDTVRPICIPHTSAEYRLVRPGNTTGEVAGWGLSHIFNLPAYVLHHASLPSVSSNKCWNSFLNISRIKNIPLPENFELTENMFCAGYQYGRSASTCYGDSGGPYMVKSKAHKKYYAMGLVSFGLSTTKCGIDTSYSVFAKINNNISQWIRNTIG